jgi:hypothetical protein
MFSSLVCLQELFRPLKEEAEKEISANKKERNEDNKRGGED